MSIDPTDDETTHTLYTQKTADYKPQTNETDYELVLAADYGLWTCRICFFRSGSQGIRSVTYPEMVSLDIRR